MARPFKPPPMQDQVLDTINPLNWFSGLIWSNFQGDIDYHLTARDHSKVQGLPPISPVDLQEGAGFGPAGLSVDPRKYFKYGLASGIKGQAKNLLKLSVTLNELDAHSDWIHGWKPVLIQESDGLSNPIANKIGLVKKIKGTTGEILQGWTDDPLNLARLSDKEKQTLANEKESRLKLFNQLEWWTKTEDIKPYRDLAWKPIMESAVEAAYYTAERQKNEGTITQAEFDHFKTEYDKVANKTLPTSSRKKAMDAESPFNSTKASRADIKEMFKRGSQTRQDYYASIKADQDYNTDLHLLFTKITTHDHHHGLIDLERDANGKRLLQNLRELDHGASHYAWKDFLQKFDKGGTLRDYIWDSVSSVDLIRVAEPIYKMLTGGKTMPIETYRFLGRLNQVGAKTFPFNAGLLIASTLNSSGYFGLSKANDIIKFNNFAFLEFRAGQIGPLGYGARFMSKQFEGILRDIGAKEGKGSLYNLINTADGHYNVMSVNQSTAYKGLTEAQVAEIGKKLLTPDDLYTYIERLLDPTWDATEKAAFLAKLRDKIDKYKGSEGFRTLKGLVDQGKLRDIELFQFLGLANLKGLGNEYQGFVGFASKFPGQMHNWLQTMSGEMWKLPGFKHLFPLWSKYKLGNLFFNNPLAMKLGASLGKLLGGAVAGPLGVILGYLIEDLLHKFIHNIWAGLTGGHPHALIGDNTKKMFIIGCGTVLAIIALPIFIIIIILGGAFAWLGAGNNESGEIIVNQDVVVNVRNLDTPISTIANNLTNPQDTKFDITIKNNLDKEITVLSVTISEYTEDNYWSGIKTLSYQTQIANNIVISANGESSTQITLPFYNAVKNGEKGRIIFLNVNATYIQTDGGAGNASGRGTLALGKIDQPIGTPYIVNGRDEGPNAISQCYHSGHKALDIGTPMHTPLYATLSGEVKICNFRNNPADSRKIGCIGYGSGYGNMILVTNGAYTILYGHLDLIPNVPANITDGVIVNVGDVIAYSGNTGHSTGPHVHYEVRNGGNLLDPWQFVSSSSGCRVTL